jgi:pyruvate,orthophosphate dikinase
MPGMMDTVLNLGLNDETVRRWRPIAGDARFAYDSYRRFIQMYSDVVLGLDHEVFEEILEDEKGRSSATNSTPSSPPPNGRTSSSATRPTSRRSWARLPAGSA